MSMSIPFGGTELMRNSLIERIDPSILESVEIVTRPEHITDSPKKKVLWVHDMPADIEFLGALAGRAKFDGIVFVSSWQQQIFNLNMGVLFSESAVIKNAIEPIDKHEKLNDGTIRLIYHPTPHRGLELLIPVYIELCKKYDNLHLDVFSNFDIYARPEMNERYEEPDEVCRTHEKITYHGSVENSAIRAALQKADIFAYPSIWRETSCLCAMEAMSARCLTVAPNYGALSETLANFSIAYDWSENARDHAQKFSQHLELAIETVHSEKTAELLEMQKAYADKFYSWDSRIAQWEAYLLSIINKPKKKVGGLTWNPR